MSITVNTSAPHRELTLIEVVKSELGITGSSHDGLLANYIKRASDFIVSHTGREFVRETVTELLPAKGSRFMTLSRRPIVSITQVKLDGSTISSTTYSIDDANAGIVFREDRWTNTGITTSFITTRPSGDGRRDWSIKYVAGYITPGSTEGESNLPSDIEFACAEIVKAWYLSRTENANIKRQRVGDASEEKFDITESRGIPPIALSVLDKWRSVDLT